MPNCRRNHRRDKLWDWIIEPILIGIGIVILATAMVSAALAAPCAINGNISSSSAKIYHLPGAAAHATAVINESRGECLFCSEDERC